MVAAIPGFAGDREVLFGMLAPLAGAAATWVLVARTFGSHPEWLTSLMVAAFAAKLVFFGAYVTVMLTVLSLQPVPFVVSFTAYFITLLLVEALCLQRFFAGKAGAGPRSPAYVRSGSLRTPSICARSLDRTFESPVREYIPARPSTAMAPGLQPS
jgi:hypothetical protein